MTVSFFLLISNGLSAQEDTIHRDIDEVVVTATRASVNRNNVPMTISVINRAEIEESSESALLPVLSERVPGLFVTQRGVTGFGVAAGGTGGITMRGVGGSPTTEVLVLIDGHPQYMGVMGHHLPDAYVASDVEKVEVIRGPASILYGSNAMGGVINIITRRQNTEGWNANGRVMYGSYNTQKYMANGGLKKGKFNGYLSVNHDRTDGHRSNSDFAITNGYLKLGYQLNEHFQVWGDASLASYEAQNPGTTADTMINNTADILRGVASVTVENNYGKLSGALKFFYNFGDHKVNDGYSKGGAPTNFFYRSTDHNYGITFYQTFRPFTGNMITAGIDYKSFGGHAWNDYTDATPNLVLLPDTSLYELGGYVIMQQTLFEKLTLNVGVRLENSERFGTEWVPQAGLSYRPLRHTVLKASVSKGFRSPTIREMYMFPPHNPDLQPERMINYEVSVGQGFFEGRLTAELTGYIADGSNLIMTQMGRNLNAGDFKNQGIEFSLRWNALKNLNIQGNYSYLHAEKPILSAPGQQAYIAASYRMHKWTLSANYQYVHDLYTQNPIPAETDPHKESYGLWNAKVSYRPLKWLDVFVKGENLTGKSYAIVYDYPMPGVTVFGGINLSLR
ncbi:MAG: TonB-dependent receptor [Bacteroidales bacterium]|nr:TonB-dependent receptor [Bacteroidales bacterium]